MSYRTIAVCLDNSSASEARLDFALDLAANFEAHLTALHLTYGPLVSYDPDGQMTGVAIEWEHVVSNKQKMAQSSFLEKTRSASLSADWHCYRSADLNDVVAHARLADLAVVGQFNPHSRENDVNSGFYDHFLIRLGKPVIYVPWANQFTAQFSTVTAAWDGTRESARAIADALPVLEMAGFVQVVSISEKQNSDGLAIAQNLRRHGVSVDVVSLDHASHDVAEQLLACAAGIGSDLLVMGAYGHHRLAELILGGATRDVMKKMTIPVLMSH